MAEDLVGEIVPKSTTARGIAPGGCEEILRNYDCGLLATLRM